MYSEMRGVTDPFTWGYNSTSAIRNPSIREQIGGFIVRIVVEFVQHDDIRSHSLQNFSHLLQVRFLSICQVLAKLSFFLQAHGDIEGRDAEVS